MLKLSLLCKAASHAILIKWVAGTLICPVLSFLSAPATLKYLNVTYFIFETSSNYYSISNEDTYALKIFKDLSNIDLSNGFYLKRIKEYIPELIKTHKNTEFTLSISF